MAFAADSIGAVDAFQAAAIAAGGIDHGPPGYRPTYGVDYYAAFVRDPDGHVIEAVCRGLRAGSSGDSIQLPSLS